MVMAYEASKKVKRGKGRPRKIASVFAVKPSKGWRKGERKYEDEGLLEFVARIDAIKAGRRMTDKAAIEQDMRAWYKSEYPKGPPLGTLKLDRWVSLRLPMFRVVLSRARTAQRRLNGDGVK